MKKLGNFAWRAKHWNFSLALEFLGRCPLCEEATCWRDAARETAAAAQQKQCRGIYQPVADVASRWCPRQDRPKTVGICECPMKRLYSFSLTFAVCSAQTSVRTPVWYALSCSAGMPMCMHAMLMWAVEGSSTALAPRQLTERTVAVRTIGVLIFAAKRTAFLETVETSIHH